MKYWRVVPAWFFTIVFFPFDKQVVVKLREPLRMGDSDVQMVSRDVW